MRNYHQYNPTTSYDMRTFGRTSQIRDRLLGEFPQFMPSDLQLDSFPHQFYVSTPDSGSNFLWKKYGISNDRLPLFIQSRGGFGRDNLGFMTFDSNYANSQQFGVHFFPGKTRGRKGMEYMILNQYQRVFNNRELLDDIEIAAIEKDLGLEINTEVRGACSRNEAELVKRELDRGAGIRTLQGIGHNMAPGKYRIPAEEEVRRRLVA